MGGRWVSMSKLRFRQLVGASMAVLASQLLMADDLYKTIDDQGHVVYSDHPVSSASQKIFLHVAPADPAEAVRLAKEQAIDAVDAVQQTHDQLTEQKKKAIQEAAQQRRCEAARNRYFLFRDGGRIYKRDEQGNRVFYSDQEIDAQRVATKAAMDSACGK